MRTHGDPGWEAFPSYFELAVPRILEFLRRRNLEITFFVVGQDAAFPNNRTLLRSIVEAGHEIGNHSFSHESWFHLYSDQQVAEEIGKAEFHIEQATGCKPVGFRGPGYSLSEQTIRELTRRGYLYDASMLPTFIGPLARAYYFRKTTLPPEARRRRSKMIGGGLREGLRPIRPYQWETDAGKLLEIPVTTMPMVHSPIHGVYLHWLARFSRTLALGYFSTALRLCGWFDVGPSLLLHPTDFLGQDDESELPFVPAMDVTSECKLALLDEVLAMLTARFSVVPMRDHAKALMKDRSFTSQQPHLP